MMRTPFLTLFLSFTGYATVPIPPDFCFKQTNMENCSIEIGPDLKTVLWSCPSAKQPTQIFSFKDSESISCVGISPTKKGTSTLSAVSTKGQVFVWSSSKDPHTPIESVAQIQILSPNWVRKISFPPQGDSFVLLKAGEEFNPKFTNMVFILNLNTHQFLDIPILSTERFAHHTFEIYWEDTNHIQISRNASTEYPFSRDKDFLLCACSDSSVLCKSFDQAKQTHLKNQGKSLIKNRAK